MDFASLTEIYPNVLATALSIGLILALRHFAIRMILKDSTKSEDRRRWVVSIRNATVLIILIIIYYIWAADIANVGTALLAFAVAMVIATKELIQCFMGSIFRTVTNMYSVGDRIEIGPHRGDVIDITPLSTTILEVGPGKASHLRTGRRVVIPNAKLIDTYVVNESSMRDFVVHYFSLPLSVKDDWKKAESILKGAAEAECKSFIDEARRHMAALEREHGLKGLPLQPRVLVEVPQSDKLNLLLRFPAPVGAQGRIEQQILRRFLDEWKPVDAEPVPETAGAETP